MRINCARLSSLVLAGVAAAALTNATFAQNPPFDPSEMWYFDVAGDSLDAGAFYQPDGWYSNDDGTWTFYKDEFFGPDARWTAAWEVVYGGGSAGVVGAGGGSVDAELVFTNNSPGFVRVEVLVNVPVDAIAGSSIMSGGVGATVTNNDAFGGDAEIRNSMALGFEEPIYNGLIDGASAQTLWTSGYSLMAIGGAASASDSDSFAGVAGPSVAGTIGVHLVVDISPFDSTTVSGIFTVIPGPAGLAVLGIAGLLGGRRRRA